MWGSVFLFFVTLTTMALMSSASTQDAANNVRTEAQAIAGSMRVYRNFVVPYAQANTSVTGPVADGNLSLPAWYSRLQGVANYVSAGKGYVYYPLASPELTYLILKASDNSINVGIKRSGTLVNPLSTTNTSIPIALPTAIPDESIVIAP